MINESTVFWEKNFLLSSGKAGKKFIDEVFRLMNKGIHGSPLEYIVHKAIMVMSNPLKTFVKLKIKASPKCIVKKDEALGINEVTKRS